jgi:hypothetical protein
MRTQEEYLERLDALSDDERAIVLEFAAYFYHVQTNTACALLHHNQDAQITALLTLLAQQQDMIDRLTVRERE